MFFFLYSDYRGFGKQKTMVATVAQTVSILSERDGSTDILWENRMVNSWMSVIPMKYEFQDETIGKIILYHL